MKSSKRKSALSNGESVEPILKDRRKLDEKKKSIEVDMMTYSQAISRPATHLTPQTLHHASSSTLQKGEVSGKSGIPDFANRKHSMEQ